MDYLLEISRIIDGAYKGDKVKVESYAAQLASKLQKNGEKKAADRILRAVSGKSPSATTAGMAVAKRLPVDSESRLALADETWVAPGEEVSVILEPVVQQRVAEFIKFIHAADKLLANGVGITPSMLMHGPPGVGKTELARYIAGQLNMPLITIRSDSLISSFLGSTAKNIRMLFEHAESRPCVLFLDEFDSIAKLRDDQRELGELKRVVVSLLQNIDSLDNQTVLLAATNHAHLLDTAVWRRFSCKVEMTLPSESSRRSLFELFLKSFRDAEDEAGVLASVSEGISGADIRQISEDAIRTAILSGSKSADTISMLREIIQIRLKRQLDFSRTDDSDIQDAHGLAPKAITQKMLAALFSSHPSTISRRLHKRVDADG